MDKISEFTELMKEYDLVLDDLLELEEDKIDAVSEDDMECLQDCLRDEEAGMLKMRGLDARREKLTKEMGFEGKTFRQILDETAAVQSKELQPLFNSINGKTERFRKLTASIQNMLESKMVANDRKLAFLTGQSNGVTDPAKVYDRNGGRVDAVTFTRSKTV